MRFDNSHIPSFPSDPNIQCGLTPIQVKIMSNVLLEGLHKYFGAVHAVQNVTLEIKDGEFAVLVGPSGCGKTTTLRMVAGLEGRPIRLKLTPGLAACGLSCSSSPGTSC